MVHTEVEQAVMFPELDDSAEHKAIIKAAKKLQKIRSERAETLRGSKEQEEKAEADLVEKLHASNITKFRHESIQVELQARAERVKIKIELDDDEEQEGEE
jgi:hypothetical protein